MGFSRERFWELLKATPQGAPQVVDRKVEVRDSYVVETLLLELQSGPTVRGFVTRPIDTEGKHLPALLYMHAHGGRYDIGAREMLEGQSYMGSPLGPLFARAGFVTLMVEMPLFGTRATVTESTLSNAIRTLGDPSK